MIVTHAHTKVQADLISRPKFASQDLKEDKSDIITPADESKA